MRTRCFPASLNYLYISRRSGVTSYDSKRPMAVIALLFIRSMLSVCSRGVWEPAAIELSSWLISLVLRFSEKDIRLEVLLP